jgi:hypothetical protein
VSRFWLPPAAQAGTDLGTDVHICDALHGKFTTEIMGGQSRSTCTFTVVGYTHDFYYSDGQFTSSDQRLVTATR